MFAQLTGGYKISIIGEKSNFCKFENFLKF